MPKCVIAVVMTVEQAHEVCHLWERLGVPGVTMLDSVGYAAMQAHLLQDNLPLIPSIRCLEEQEEIQHYRRMLLSVVGDEFDLERLVEETDRLVGRFSTPHSGILFVLPVLEVRGLRRREE